MFSFTRENRGVTYPHLNHLERELLMKQEHVAADCPHENLRRSCTSVCRKRTGQAPQSSAPAQRTWWKPRRTVLEWPPLEEGLIPCLFFYPCLPFTYFWLLSFILISSFWGTCI